MDVELVLPTHKHCQALMELVKTGYRHLPDLGRPISVRAQETVYAYGEIVGRLYLVREGRVRTSMLSTEGRELVTGIHNPGDMFGQFCLCSQHPRNEQATAVEDSVVVGLGVEDLIELAATRDGALGLLQLFCNRISALEEQVAQLAFAKVRTRLGLLLLQIAEEGEPLEDGRRVCRDHPTHEEMANRIGTTREQVSSLLTQFRKAGLVEYERTGPLVIDPKRLRDELDEV